jgi:hypothetical protein
LKISRLRKVGSLASNQRVGSSNLSGRAFEVELVAIEHETTSNGVTYGFTQTHPKETQLGKLILISFVRAMAAGSVGQHIAGELDARIYDTGDFKRTAGACKALGIVDDNMILLLYKKAQMEANAVLQTNWPAVVELAELLLAHGRVEGSDVHQMVETHRARSASN